MNVLRRGVIARTSGLADGRGLGLLGALIILASSFQVTYAQGDDQGWIWQRERLRKTRVSAAVSEVARGWVPESPGGTACSWTTWEGYNRGECSFSDTEGASSVGNVALQITWFESPQVASQWWSNRFSFYDRSFQLTDEEGNPIGVKRYHYLQPLTLGSALLGIEGAGQVLGVAKGTPGQPGAQGTYTFKYDRFILQVGELYRTDVPELKNVLEWQSTQLLGAVLKIDPVNLIQVAVSVKVGVDDEKGPYFEPQVLVGLDVEARPGEIELAASVELSDPPKPEDKYGVIGLEPTGDEAFKAPQGFISWKNAHSYSFVMEERDAGGDPAAPRVLYLSDFGLDATYAGSFLFRCEARFVHAVGNAAVRFPSPQQGGWEGFHTTFSAGNNFIPYDSSAWKVERSEAWQDPPDFDDGVYEVGVSSSSTHVEEVIDFSAIASLRTVPEGVRTAQDHGTTEVSLDTGTIVDTDLVGPMPQGSEGGAGAAAINSDRYGLQTNVFGNYRIIERLNGSTSILVDWTHSDALRSGYGNWNQLRLVKQGGSLQFYANDTLLNSIQDLAFNSGRISLRASIPEGSGNRVQFDNFSLVPLNGGTTATLTIQKEGTGSGTVTSDPAGIACGGDCSKGYDLGSSLTLTATPDPLSSFSGWSGACTGTGPCQVTLDQSTIVTASFTLGSWGSCTYSLSPTTRSHGPAPETGAVIVTAATDCSWSAQSDAPWVTLLSGTEGTGSGTVTYSLPMNQGSAARSASIQIEDQIFNVTQSGVAPCSVLVSPSTRTHGIDPAQGSFEVQAPGNCQWAAQSHASWIQLLSGATGSGNGQVTYQVGNAPGCRSGSISIGDRVATIVQESGDATWAGIGPDGTSVTALGIHPQDSDIIYAASHSGAVLKTLDLGAHWQSLSTGISTSGSVTDFVFDPPSTVYASVRSDLQSGFYKSIDNGASWSRMDTSTINAGFQCLAGSGPSLYACTHGAGVAVSTDGGVHWNTANQGLTSPAVYDLLVHGSAVYAATGQGVAKSVDGGSNWAEVLQLGVAALSLAGDPNSSDTLYAGASSPGGAGVLFKTVDGGSTWTRVDTGLPPNPGVQSIAVLEDELWAQTTSVYKSTDGGASWTQASDGLTFSAATVLKPDPVEFTKVFAGNIGDGVFVTRASGGPCTFTTSFGNPGETGQHGSGPGSGTIEVTAPQGSTWTATSDRDWITIRSGQQGTGPGNVEYEVAPNPTSQPRNGSITVGDQTIPITQEAGKDPVHSCTTQSLAGDGTITGSLSAADCQGSPKGTGYYSEKVTYEGTVGERITISATWTGFDGSVSLIAPSGALVAFNDDYPDSLGSRISNYTLGETGTYEIWVTTVGKEQTGDFSLTVTSGCKVTLLPTSRSHGSVSGTGSFAINAPDGCDWTVTSDAVWVTVTSAAGGSGYGTVDYSIPQNLGGARSGTISVDEETFFVQQAETTAVNHPPTANAGPDLNAASGAQVMLNGSGTDPDQDPLAYNWTQTDDPVTVTLQNADTAEAGFTAPDVSQPTDLHFRLTVNDGKGGSDRDDTIVQVHPADPNIMVAPVSLDLSTVDASALDPFPRVFENTFVGLALANPNEVANDATVSALASDGTLKKTITPEPIPPQGQLAFVTGEYVANDLGAISLIARGTQGPVQGFFMAGNNNLYRLDGVGGRLRSAERLYFPIMRHNSEETTYLFLFNPNESPVELKLKLYDPDGLELAQTTRTVSGSGTVAATLEQFFGSIQLTEGWVEVIGDGKFNGFEFVGQEGAVSAFIGLPSEKTETLMAPHFFVAQNGGSTIRLLNLSNGRAVVTLKVFDNSAVQIAAKQFDIGARQLYVARLQDLLGLDIGASQTITGYLTLEIVAASLGGFPVEPKVVGALTFSGEGEKYVSTLPLVVEGRLQTLVLHVAQSSLFNIFTGLAILVPGEAAAKVTVQVFNQAGENVAETELAIPAGQRIVDLLNGESYFGSTFEQVGGHLKILSDVPVVVFALFGDLNLEYMAAIEGQSPVVQ